MTSFVLVPGAGGAPWTWHRVVPLLEAAGHRAVVVDLPGDDPEATLEDSIDRVVGAADLAEPVLVAHSFGGFSAAAAAARVPVQELVLVNAMIPAPGESGAQWWAAVGQREARREAERAAGRDPSFSFESVFLHDLTDDLARGTVEHDREQADRAFNDPWPSAAWPDVPTRVIVSADDRLFPVTLQERVARDRLGLDVALVPGGHLNLLSRPSELVAELLAPHASRA